MNPTWNRRTFLTTLGLTTAAASLPAAPLPAAPSAIPNASPAPAEQPAFAFLSHSKMTQGGDRSIQTFSITRDGWVDNLYPFEIFAPLTLTTHPALPILYTAGSPQGLTNRRQGHVTAVAIDAAETISLEQLYARSSHWLHTINRQPLALDTTEPSAIAVTPDGRTLLVADHQGGNYNLFPLAADGSIEPLRHVLKQTGTPSASARPHSLLVHPRGHLAYTTDLHRLELGVLTLDEPQPRPVRALSFGSPPAYLALHPSGKFLFVTHSDGTLSVVPLDSATGLVTSASTHYRLASADFAGPVLFNATGDRAYTTTSRRIPHKYREPASLTTLHTLRVSRSGKVSKLHSTPCPGLHTAAALALHRHQLTLVGHGQSLTFPIDSRTGLPETPFTIGYSGRFTGIVIRTV